MCKDRNLQKINYYNIKEGRITRDEIDGVYSFSATNNTFSLGFVLSPVSVI